MPTPSPIFGPLLSPTFKFGAGVGSGNWELVEFGFVERGELELGVVEREELEVGIVK